MSDEIKGLEIKGYGEDSLTLWALKNKLKEIIEGCLSSDEIYDLKKCEVYYRPSFGRGEYGIGEFDFIIKVNGKIILGESKWWKSGEVTSNGIKLRDAQVNRHKNLIATLENGYKKGYINNKGELPKKCDKWDKKDLYKTFDKLFKGVDNNNIIEIINCVLVLNPNRYKDTKRDNSIFLKLQTNNKEEFKIKWKVVEIKTESDDGFVTL